MQARWRRLGLVRRKVVAVFAVMPLAINLLRDVRKRSAPSSFRPDCLNEDHASLMLDRQNGREFHLQGRPGIVFAVATSTTIPGAQ
jgi:hypothetical protein